MIVFRVSAILAAFLFFSACTTEIAPETAQSGLGNFSLDRTVVVVDQPTLGAFSRRAEKGEIEEAVGNALSDRFGRFDGDGTYSIGVKVQGYVLALPGIPVVAAPRSMLLLSINVYDDVPKRLNTKPRNMTIFEDAGGDTVLGSGYTQSGQQQLVELSENAAIEIERWLRKNEQWFGGASARPEAGPARPVPVPTEAETGA